MYLQYGVGEGGGNRKQMRGYQLGPTALLMSFSGFILCVCLSAYERAAKSNGEAFLKRFISKYLRWEDNYKLIR